MVMRRLSPGHLEGVWGTSLSLQAGGTLAREEADFGGARGGVLGRNGLVWRQTGCHLRGGVTKGILQVFPPRKHVSSVQSETLLSLFESF